MIQHPDFKVLPAGEAKCVSLVGDVYQFLSEGEETGGRFAMIEATVSPQGGPPPHIHRREDELFYVLEGELEFLYNGQKTNASPGAFVYLPRNTLHCFKNIGAKPARMIVEVVPSGLEKFFQEAGTPLPSASAKPVPVTPGDIDKLKTVAAKYGIELQSPAGN
jgi:quercetin dioxygenase-like cupin family protein